MCTCSPEREPDHGLHGQKCDQQVEGDESDTVCYAHKTPSVSITAFPSINKEVGLLEWVQRRGMEMLRGLEHLSHEHRLRAVGFIRMEKRRLQGDLIMAFQYFKSDHKNINILCRQLVIGKGGIPLN